MQAPLRVAGQVDHAGHGPVAGADPAGPPDVLVDAEGVDPDQPVPGRRPAGSPRPRSRPSSVCQSTPRCRASAETVVSSCASASVAQLTARVVSFARGATISWCSVNVPVGAGGLAAPPDPLPTTATGPGRRSTAHRPPRDAGGRARPRPPRTTDTRRRRRRTRPPARACSSSPFDVKHVHPGDVEHRIGSSAPAHRPACATSTGPEHRNTVRRRPGGRADHGQPRSHRKTHFPGIQ